VIYVLSVQKDLFFLVRLFLGLNEGLFPDGNPFAKGLSCYTHKEARASGQGSLFTLRTDRRLFRKLISTASSIYGWMHYLGSLDIGRLNR
jgi:hypothetical protein